jgi:hypothetical protein
MGQKSAKASNSSAPPQDFVLIVKEEWCGGCRGLMAMLNQYRQTHPMTNIYLRSEKDALAEYGPLVKYAYDKEGSQGFPLLIRVKNGKYNGSQLGSFRNVQGLKTFLSGLRL